MGCSGTCSGDCSGDCNKEPKKLSGGEYLALALKSYSEEIIASMGDRGLLKQVDFKQILDNGVHKFFKELQRKEDVEPKITIAAFNIILLNLANYSIIERKIYDDYLKVPVSVHAERRRILDYLNHTILKQIPTNKDSENNGVAGDSKKE